MQSSTVSSYSSRAADIWALGIILINMITRRSPWDMAYEGDELYTSYTQDRALLKKRLHLSQSAFVLLDKIFYNHGANLNIAELREDAYKIDSFYDAEYLRTLEESRKTVSDGGKSNSDVAERSSSQSECRLVKPRTRPWTHHIAMRQHYRSRRLLSVSSAARLRSSSSIESSPGPRTPVTRAVDLDDAAVNSPEDVVIEQIHYASLADAPKCEPVVETTVKRTIDRRFSSYYRDLEAAAAQQQAL